MPRPLHRPVRVLAALALALAGLAGTTDSAGAAVVLPRVTPGAQATTVPATGVFTVTGHGWGHGVGMSQYGANGAAAGGLSYAQILAHYYPGTTLVARPARLIRVGLTLGSTSTLQLPPVPGLRVATARGAQLLPAGPRAWRVRAVGSGCTLEALTGARWAPVGLAVPPVGACPVAFTAPGGVAVRNAFGTTHTYAGTVSAVRSGTRLVGVNTLPLETYLRAVVPAESPAYFRPAALAAQAVAARTYAARTMTGAGVYDVCDSTACQSYPGLVTTTTAGVRTVHPQPSTDAAVTATAGKVLTYRGALALTMFSASNGGYTVAAAGYPYLPAQPDPYDAVADPLHDWAARVPATALAQAFGLARVLRVQVLARDGHGPWGGRVASALVEGTTGAGAYRAVRASGTALAAAYGWPEHAAGLRGTYLSFTGR